MYSSGRTSPSALQFFSAGTETQKKECSTQKSRTMKYSFTRTCRRAAHHRTDRHTDRVRESTDEALFCSRLGTGGKESGDMAFGSVSLVGRC